MTREVVVLSGVRTAIGGYGGSLKDIPPSDLAAICVREAVSRAGIEPAEVGHVVFGNIIHTDSHDHYLARVAGVKGGLPHETPALTLNRLCGSGLQAIITAAQAIMLGDADVAVAGGAENMSRSPYFAPAMRWGARMNDTTLIDVMVGALSDPFDDVHMGVTAENVAKKYQDLARGSGHTGRREPSPGGQRHRSWLLQGPDRAGRGQGQEGHGAVRGRRDRSPRQHGRKAGPVEAGVRSQRDR